MTDQSLTQILDAIDRGEKDASKRLMEIVYDELRLLARRQMQQEASGHTLQPTALVHEAWLRLLGDGAMQWDNRGHFFAVAAEAMRRILVESARRRASLKRGGAFERVALTSDPAWSAPGASDSLLALNEALQKLELEDPDSYQVVMLRNFGGLTIEETAEAMGNSPRTVKRLWSFARAWLQREIRSE